MARKHYTGEKTYDLLSRLVAASCGEHTSPREAKAVLRALLEWKFDDVDVAVGGRARKELRSWATVHVRGALKHLSGFLKSLVLPAPEGFKVGVFLRVEKLKIGADRSGDAVTLRVDGSALDLLTFKMLSLLRTTGVQRLQHCECGRIFVRFGKRTHCTTRCQRKFYMRRFRARDEPEE